MDRNQVHRMLESVSHRHLVESNAGAIASTIKKQIMAADYWALARWGSRDYQVIGAGINSKLGDVTTPSGLDWKVKGSKFSGNVRVCLNPATDTYDIYLYTTRAYKLKIVSTKTDIYVDNLTEVLESLIG